MNDTNNIQDLQIGSFFDTSVLDSKDLSDDEFKSYLVNQVQNVLNKEFSNVWQKRKLKVCRDRIQCACPICGDSMQDLSKKRGNFIISGKFAGKYKCFNCGHFMSISKFFEMYNNPLSLDSIDYLAKHQTDLQLNYNLAANSSDNINCLFDEEMIDEYSIDRDKFIAKFNLLSCSASDFHKGATYIKSRHLNNFNNFLYEPINNVLFILNLTNSGKIIGFQIRRLKPKKGESKYMTYSLKSIYKYFFRIEDIEIPDSVDTL